MNSKGKFKPEIAAAVLLTAAYANDEDACKKYGVSIRSLQNWRRRLIEDDEFALFFATKNAEASKKWADELPIALNKSLKFLGEAADAARLDRNHRMNPMVIQAVAGAMKLIADVHLTSRVIDARLASTDRPENGLPEQVSAGQQSVEYEN